MKRITVVLLALAVAAAAFVGPNATAGMFKKDKFKRTEKPEHLKKPRRFTDRPPMSFHAGELQQDNWTGWQLGELKLKFADDCLVTQNGAVVGRLTAGRQAVVMGNKVGDTIVAWTVQIRGRQPASLDYLGADIQEKKSVTNPNCGEILRAAE